MGRFPAIPEGYHFALCEGEAGKISCDVLCCSGSASSGYGAAAMLVPLQRNTSQCARKYISHRHDFGTRMRGEIVAPETTIILRHQGTKAPNYKTGLNVWPTTKLC